MIDRLFPSMTIFCEGTIIVTLGENIVKQKTVSSFLVRMLVVIAAFFLAWGVVAFIPSDVQANDKREDD